jgi:hypothetical protein
MDDGYGGDYNVIYNGRNYPNVLKYTVSGLITGLQYNFKLAAINFNGLSPESPSVAYTICVKPSNFKAPSLTGVTRTSMTLAWNAPVSNGGCSITSY